MIGDRAWMRLRSWWANQLPLPCARCGGTIHPTDPWDLDHQVARAVGGSDDTARPSHRACNRKAGAEVRAYRQAQVMASTPSRSW